MANFYTKRMIKNSSTTWHEISWLRSWLLTFLLTQSKRGKELASKPHASRSNILLLPYNQEAYKIFGEEAFSPIQND